MNDGVRTPIQLQSSKDHIFLKNLLELSPGHAQQASDLNSSDNDLDCNVLLNSSDSDDASTQLCSFDRTSASILFIYLGFYVAFNTVQVISR